MLSRSFTLVVKKVLTNPMLYSLRGLVCLALLLMLNAGCSQVSSTVQQLPSLIPNFSTEAKFQLRVASSGRLGVYTVEGSTNLPDDSRVSIAAVRTLRPDKPVSENLNPNLTYSILAYQDVRVNKGKWQTTLNLWNVAPDGRFQEAWQLEQSKLGLSLKPDPEVTFIATVEPTDELSELESRLEKQGIKLVSSIVRNTADGEQFVQVRQVLPIPLPTGQTTPPEQRLEDVNGGWGPRYLLIPEPPNILKLEMPKNRRTNAPLSPTELMQ